MEGIGKNTLSLQGGAEWHLERPGPVGTGVNQMKKKGYEVGKRQE